MKKVCVITGGGSGRRLAAARILVQQGYYVILAGRAAAKLENAVQELKNLGGEAEAVSCDVSDSSAAEALAYIKYNAIKRMGKPEEIAQLFAYLVVERLGYLTGTDIICDGGCIAGGAHSLGNK
jgi:NAD(P)-dependent dehydrogenase (short-subunit alcohol dehydrogenase family)